MYLRTRWIGLPMSRRMKLLKDFVVLFIMPDTPLVLEGFLCDAEDTAHAEEQAEDAYPGCDIVWIEEGNDAYGAMDRYWGEQG